MNTFTHNTEDIIFINNTVIPLSFFLTLVPTYSLPSGATSRYYDDTYAHWTSDGKTATPQTFPYTDGDTYIANEAAYASAYSAYLNPTSPLDTAKANQIILMLQYSDNIRNGYVIHNGHQFFTTPSILNELEFEDLAYIRASALPSNYYVNDVGYNHVLMANLADFASLLDEIVQLHYLCRLNEDAHRTAINALGTVEAVEAYDYTTGWPITPYSPYITFYSKYNTTVNATYSAGVGTGTANGDASIAGSLLLLGHESVGYVDYTATANANSQQKGYITFWVQPNYSGAPATDKVFVTASKANSDATNLIEVRHLSATSNIQLTIKGQTNANIISTSLGLWTPVANTFYKFSLYFDITNGNTFLMINDVQLGSTSVATGTRSSSIGLLRVGASYDSTASITSNFAMKELIIASQ